MNNRTRYFLKFDNKNRPILGSMVARFKKPADSGGGKWKDITACLGICCLGGSGSVSAPATFELADGATGSIVATWSSVTDATSYKLERATDATFTTALTTVQNTYALSKTDTGLTSGVIYYYRLSTISASGASGFTYANHVAP